jgi:hypothetical protein
MRTTTRHRRGVSLAMPAAQNAVIAAVRPHEIGTASGAYNMFRYLGGSFGVAILATVFADAGSTHRRTPSATASRQR